MFIFSLSIAIWLWASKKEPSSAGDSCVTLSKPLYLSKSWLGPLNGGDTHFYFLPDLPTAVSVLTKIQAGREERWPGEKFWLARYFHTKVPCPLGLKGVSRWHFMGSLETLSQDTVHITLSRAEPPSSSPPHSYQLLVPRRLSTSGILRTIFQPRVPQLDPGVLPLNIPSEDRVNSS